MGYHLSSVNTPSKLDVYIGRVTMRSIADNGGFDSGVSDYWEQYADENENVMAIVDETGVNHFLEVLKSGVCRGRDIQMLIDTVEGEYMEGFIIVG